MRVYRAPGRVNLMGDHTDYHQGFVLPAAIDLEARVRVAPREDGQVVARSHGFEGEVVLPADGTAEPTGVEPPWGRLVAGVVAALADRGRPAVGADLSISSTVPAGSGLSSSAALEVALALALDGIAGVERPPLELAKACQEAERAATGVPSGVMDQLASAAGVAGHALLIDCRAGTVLPVVMPEDVAVLVVHSGVERALPATPYAEVRARGDAAAVDLGLASLRDADPEQVPEDPVARHVVTENARVVATALALAAGDVEAVAAAYAASQASLRDDLGCSTPEVDRLVDDLLAAGAIGARITGAGWGGCVVALAHRDRLAEVEAAASGRTHWVVRAADGAGPTNAA